MTKKKKQKIKLQHGKPKMQIKIQDFGRDFIMKKTKVLNSVKFKQNNLLKITSFPLL